MVLHVMKTVATVSTMMYVTKPLVTVQMDVLLDMKGILAKKVLKGKPKINILFVHCVSLHLVILIRNTEGHCKPVEIGQALAIQKGAARLV